MTRGQSSPAAVVPATSAGGVVSCPFAAAGLEVVVVGDDEQPLDDVPVELSDGRSSRVLLARTDARGCCQLYGVAAGRYRLRLPSVDRSLWRLLGPVGGAVEVASAAPAVWQEAREPAPIELACDGTEQIEVIARQLGVPRERLLDAATGRPVEGDAPALGTRLLVEPPRPRFEDVETGRRYVVHRLGLPLWLALRLVDAGLRAHADCPYLCKAWLADGAEVPSREGRTDEKGRVVEWLPATATRAELIVATGGARPLRIRVKLAALSTEAPEAFQERLEHLGYSCGGERGKIGAATRAALELFQIATGLPPTGALDDLTRGALLALHRS